MEYSSSKSGNIILGAFLIGAVMSGISGVCSATYHFNKGRQYENYTHQVLMTDERRMELHDLALQEKVKAKAGGLEGLVFFGLGCVGIAIAPKSF